MAQGDCSVVQYMAHMCKALGLIPGANGWAGCGQAWTDLQGALDRDSSFPGAQRAEDEDVGSRALVGCGGNAEEDKAQWLGRRQRVDRR